MDMTITGTGMIAAGEYDSVRISGKGKSEGHIRCKDFICSGSFSGASDIECENRMEISGSFKNTGALGTRSLHISGSAENGGAVSAETVSTSGRFEVKGIIRASDFSVHGVLVACDDIEVEKVAVHGRISCAGLINAEEFSIKMADNCKSEAESLGGSLIFIRKKFSLNLFAGIRKAFRFAVPLFTVAESIEGDEIDIEYTKAKTVRGRSVKIGKGCEIDLIQYTEAADISPGAKVGKVEKI